MMNWEGIITRLLKMWNKDLKHMQEMSQEPLWESIAAFVCMAILTYTIWIGLALIAL